MVAVYAGPPRLMTVLANPRRRGGVLGPVLRTSEAAYLSGQYNPAAKEWLKDLTGNGHHMRIGSVGRADIVDGALVLNGVTGQYAMSPDHADLDIVGDITLDVEVALDDWTPSAQCTLLSKYSASGDQRGYRLVIQTSGVPQLSWSTAGTAITTVFPSATAAVPATDGQRIWVRASLDVDNGGSYNLRFFTSPTGVDGSWVQLGALVTGPATSIFANTANLIVGAYEGGVTEPVAGRFSRARIYNGFFDGTTQTGSVVFDADFSTRTDGTPWFLEATGKRVTVQPGRAVVVDGALWLPGLAQYAITADHADLDGFTEMELVTKVALDDWTPATANALMAKENAAGTARSWRWLISATTGTLSLLTSLDGVVFGATATSTDSPTVANGDPLWLKATWRGSDGRVQFFTSVDGVAWTQLGIDRLGVVGTLANTDATMSVGARSVSSETLTGKIYRAIVKSGIDGTTTFDTDFTTWGNGEGMGGFPKREATNKAVVVIGDTTGTDTNDPKWLAYAQDSTMPSKAKGLYLPGIAGNYASVPDEAALSITGDITLDAEVALDDWTPAASTQLVSSLTTGAAGSGYEMRVNTTGTLRFSFNDGTADRTHDSTVAVPAVDGERLWARASLDINNGAAGRDVKFFTSKDGVTWTQLGTTVTTASVLAIADAAAGLHIGARPPGTAEMATGRFFRARIYNGYFDGTTQGGSLVLDIDFADATEPYATFAADTGQTVTINRSTTGRKACVVDRPLFLFGTDDYMECADHADLDFAAADSLSVAVAQRRYGLPASATNVLLSKKVDGGVTAGYQLALNSGDSNPRITIGDGVASSARLTSGALLGGEAETIVGVRNIGADVVASAVSPDPLVTVADTTTGSLANTEALRAGRHSGAGTAYNDGEMSGWAVWRLALTDADEAALDGEFATSS